MSNGLAAEAMTPMGWTYLYDHTPLGKTLEKYVDFGKLAPQRQSGTGGQARLILTCVDVLTAKHLIYDSQWTNIDVRHILCQRSIPDLWFSLDRDRAGSLWMGWRFDGQHSPAGSH